MSLGPLQHICRTAHPKRTGLLVSWCSSRLSSSAWGFSSWLSNLSTSCSSHSPGQAAVAVQQQQEAPEYTVVYHALPEYKMDIDEATQLRSAITIIRRLQDAGHQAYVVGGWVRDKFLRRPALDVDIATSASAVEVMRMFPMGHELPRSTVRVGVPETGGAFEVTTFRGYTRVGRAAAPSSPGSRTTLAALTAAAAAQAGVDSHASAAPSSPDRRLDPMFSAYMDAAMRDFSINSLFYDPVTERVLDLVGGVADIQNRVLRLNRTPRDYADPAVRSHYMLSDDPIRVLRAVRFVATLPGGFRLDDESVRHLKEYAPRCSERNGISRGRMQREVAKLDATPESFATAVELAERLGLLPHIFPFLDKQPAEVTRRGVAAVARLTSCRMPLALRAAALLRPAPAKDGTFRSLYQPVSDCFQSSRGARTPQGVDTLCLMADLVSSGSREQDKWVAAYAKDFCRESVQVLGAWMGQPLATQLLQYHDDCMAQWAPAIHEARCRPHSTGLLPGRS